MAHARSARRPPRRVYRSPYRRIATAAVVIILLTCLALFMTYRALGPHRLTDDAARALVLEAIRWPERAALSRTDPPPVHVVHAIRFGARSAPAYVELSATPEEIEQWMAQMRAAGGSLNGASPGAVDVPVAKLAERYAVVLKHKPKWWTPDALPDAKIIDAGGNLLIASPATGRVLIYAQVAN